MCEGTACFRGQGPFRKACPCRIPMRPSRRATGEPVRRYEHDHPGAMLNVDVKKLGNTPTAEAGGTSADNKANATELSHPTNPETSTGTR